MISTISLTRAVGREELTALLPLGIANLPRKIRSILPKAFALDVHRDGAKFEQRDQAVLSSRA